MKRLLSQRAYAKHRAVRRLSGTSPAAVGRAVKSGRLDGALVDVGGGRILVDAEAADAAWEDNTRPRVDLHATAPSRAATDDAPDGHVTYADYRRELELVEAFAAVALGAGIDRETLHARVAVRWICQDDHPASDEQHLDEILEEATDAIAAERPARRARR